jgi:hypothetical protein
MRQLSKQQDFLRDLFFLYMMAFDNDLDSDIMYQKKTLGNNGGTIFVSAT